jgi:biopolymer transport protein ExbD
VIFIITTPQLMNNLEINLPSGKPPDQKPKVQPTRIEVSAQGQITLNQAPVTVAQLKEKLAALKSADPEMGVVVKGADDTDYQIMVSVLDTLRQLDITKMGMATD